MKTAESSAHVFIEDLTSSSLTGCYGANERVVCHIAHQLHQAMSLSELHQACRYVPSQMKLSVRGNVDQDPTDWIATGKAPTSLCCCH